MTGEKDMYDVEAVKKAAALCGSTSKLAIAAEVNYGSAFKWVHGKSVPSPLSCVKIEKATDGRVTREDIRPDFDWKKFKWF